MIKINIVLQIATDKSSIATVPSLSDFRYWATAVQRELGIDFAEVGVRIVDNAESEELNRRYRRQARPTNVLSFPAEFPILVTPAYLGDIVMAERLVVDEAQAQEKPLFDHWAHLFVHGMLHLQGYCHHDEREAQKMESCEIKILSALEIANPYQTKTASSLA